jgi:hypothetical protein
MEYTPLADPFMIRFEKDGFEYEAEVVYAKSKSSCTNFFNVEITKPKGVEPFCLKEKPILSSEPGKMFWVDAYDKQSILYQLIGDEIAQHLKNHLGIFLLDAPVNESVHD